METPETPGPAGRPGGERPTPSSRPAHDRGVSPSQAGPATGGTHGTQTWPAGPRLDRSAVTRARVEADRLVRAYQYQEAARLLAATVTRATGSLPPTDPEMIGLRMTLADVLLQSSNFRQAGPVFGELAAYLAELEGPGSERALRCRLEEATCYALAGEADRALDLMESLLRDREQVFGADDSGALELRRQIGLLQLGSGRRAAARATLAALESDLLRLHGPDHPAVDAVRGLLAGFSPPPGG